MDFKERQKFFFKLHGAIGKATGFHPSIIARFRSIAVHNNYTQSQVREFLVERLKRPKNKRKHSKQYYKTIIKQLRLITDKQWNLIVMPVNPEKPEGVIEFIKSQKIT